MAEQKLRVDLLLDSSKFASGLKKAEGSLKGFGTKMTSIGKSLATRLTLPIGLAGGAAIKMASDFEESMNKVDVAFKSSSGEVKEFAKTSLESFGIARGTALDMAALFGDMSTSMGLSTAEAANMSTALVGLAGDLASFKNMNIEEVTTALNGVFTGETESLKRLGIVMTEVNLKQFALEQGITKNIKTMTQAEKVNLRYQYVIAKTGNAQGDFARTSGGAANQMRIFQESMKELGASFGQVILPAFTSFVKKANGIVKAFKNLTPSAKKFVVQIAALTAALPILVTAFGGLATAFAFIISPVGLVVAALAGIMYYFDDIANASVRLKNSLLKNIGTALIKVEEYLKKYLVRPIQFAAKVVSEFSEDPFNIDFSKIKDDFTKQGELISEEAQKKLDENLALAAKKNGLPKYKNILSKLGKSVLQSTMGGLTAGGGRQEQSVNAGISAQGGVGQSQIVVPTQAEQVTALKGKLSELNTQILFNKVSQDEYNEAMQRSTEVAIGLGESVSGTLQQSIMNLSQGGNFFAPIIESLKKLVIRLLAAAAAAAVLNALLPGFGGGAAMKGIGGFKGMFSQLAGLPKFANGGIVSGPTLGLMGEYSGAKSNPEVIAPLNKLQGMIGNKSQNINVGGSFRVQGQDLVLALQKANKERNRML